MVVIVSDFFDPKGVESLIASFKQLRHKLLLVQLVRQTDRTPDLEGDVEVVDCETGEFEEISLTPEMLSAYRESYDRFQERLVTFAKQRSAGLLSLQVEQDVVPQLAQLFEGGTYVP